MRISTMKWLSGVLVLGVCLLAGKGSSGADDPEEKKAAAAAKEAVLKLADGKGDPKDIANKNTLEYVMRSFRVRARGGVGVGAPGGMADGIEARLIALAKTKLTAGQLKAQAADLTRMLEVTKAIGDISAFYPDAAKKAPEKWKKFNEDMIQGTKEVQAGIKGADPAKLQTAILKLSTTCNECHSVFRMN